MGMTTIRLGDLTDVARQDGACLAQSRAQMESRVRDLMRRRADRSEKHLELIRRASERAGEQVQKFLDSRPKKPVQQPSSNQVPGKPRDDNAKDSSGTFSLFSNTVGDTFPRD
jgi:hypothetical protein